MRPFVTAVFLLFAGPALASSIPELSEPPAAEIRVDHRAEWDAWLRGQRQTQIQRLSDYSNAGVFPRNMDQAGFAHQLLDKDGNPCAMAYLVMQTDPGLIRETARRHNELVMADQPDGPFADWILTSGLTREEVAVIQVPGWNEAYLENLVPDPVYTEQMRLQGHFNAVLAVLQADTEPSIALQLERLGERIHEAPPQVLAVN